MSDDSFHRFNRVDIPTSIWIISSWGKRSAVDAFFLVVAKWTPIVMMVVIILGMADQAGSQTSINLFRFSGLCSLVSAVVARLINEPISRYFVRSRPFEKLTFSPLLGHSGGRGFPSNHATGAFALSMSFVLIPDTFYLLLTLAVLLSVSRWYVGLHYFTDIVAGCLHGTTVAWIIVYLGWAYLPPILHVFALTVASYS